MKACIISNETKKLALETEEKLKEYFQLKKVEIVSKEKLAEAHMVIVIGGDGTLLRAAKDILRLPKAIDVFPVNAGSLGFLTEIKVDEIIETLEEYIGGEYSIEERGVLSVRISGKEYEALNEILISKGGYMEKILKIHVDSLGGYVNDYKSDGLIIATPTGSTAYSLSVGGPIVVPSLKAMILTPIAPHNLTARTIVIDGNEHIKISLSDHREGYIVIDGESYGKLENNDIIEISYSKKNLRLVLPKNRSYYSILREKLKWGDNLC